MLDPIVTAPFMTFEEFIEQYAGKRYEYLEGHALPMGAEFIDDQGEIIVMPPKLIHGLIVGQIFALLTLYLHGKKLGCLLGAETGFLMRQTPRELRSADVAFVPQDRLSQLDEKNIWLPFPPDFAVEVISEWDKAADVRRKIKSYMANGTRLLWVVYPIDREIEVHIPDQSVWIAGSGDSLDGGEVLPEFRVTVDDIFSVLDEE
jgi:Uma2 family endonuclease